MGMVVIVIAIVLFDSVSGKTRLGIDTLKKDETVSYQGGVDPSTYTNPASYSTESEDDSRAWLGIEPVDVTESMSQQLGLGISGGVLVSRVIEGSPAEKAGLLPGDIIYEFDHREVTNIQELSGLLSQAEIGDRVRVDLLREDRHRVFYVKLGAAVDAGSTSSVRLIAGEIIPNDLRWGIVISELTEPLSQIYNIPGKEDGVIVLMVVKGSAADKAGIEKGDVIRQVDQTRIYDLADFFEALGSSKGNNILLNICRQGTLLFINITAASPFPPEVGPGQQIPGIPIAQEGVGMSRPLYVPGYDQTQNGTPEDKTRTPSGTSIKVIAGDTTDIEDAPVCKRIVEGLEV